MLILDTYTYIAKQILIEKTQIQIKKEYKQVKMLLESNRMEGEGDLLSYNEKNIYTYLII